MSVMLKAALRLAELGVPTFQTAPRSKEPLAGSRGVLEATIDAAAIRQRYTDVPDGNVAIACGPANIVVLDIDPRNGGDESYAALEAKFGKLSTAEVQTGGGGTHYYLRLPVGVTVRSRSNAFGPEFPGVDVKSEGGYVLAPPSIHPSGKPYRWDVGGRKIAEIPQSWLTALLSQEREKKIIPGADDGAIIREGGRHETLVRLAGRLRREGMTEPAIADALHAINERQCEPKLDDAEINSIAKSAMQWEPDARGILHSATSPNGKPARNGHTTTKPPKERPRLTRHDRLDIPPADAEKIDGSALLDEIVTFILRFVIFLKGRDAATVIALWVVHTFAIEAADFTPYINVKSAAKRCAKSLTLDVLEMLAASPIKTVNISGAALYRVIEHEQPTLLADEADTIFAQNRKGSDQAEILRGLYNAGFQRGSRVIRCEGPSLTPRAFETFGPKVVAGIGEIPDTIKDRAFAIVLQRKKTDERVEKFRAKLVADEAALLRHKMAAWAARHIDALRSASPEPVPGIENPRVQDVAEPLLAIADVAGGVWPKVAREALRVLCTDEAADDDSTDAALLRAIRRAFDEREAERIKTKDLLETLAHDDGAPPIDRDRDGRPVSPAHRLAALLKPYRIKSKKIRFGDETAQGYERAQFSDVWERYDPVPVTPLESPEHRNIGTTLEKQGFFESKASACSDVPEFSGVVSAAPPATESDIDEEAAWA